MELNPGVAWSWWIRTTLYFLTLVKGNLKETKASQGNFIHALLHSHPRAGIIYTRRQVLGRHMAILFIFCNIGRTKVCGSYHHMWSLVLGPLYMRSQGQLLVSDMRKSLYAIGPIH
jgi:hypothetical protein